MIIEMPMDPLTEETIYLDIGFTDTELAQPAPDRYKADEALVNQKIHITAIEREIIKLSKKLASGKLPPDSFADAMNDLRVLHKGLDEEEKRLSVMCQVAVTA